MVKTLNTIQKELGDLLATDRRSLEDSYGEIKKSLHNKICKRITFLKTCVVYLESNPSAEFLKKEQERLSKRIELIEDGYKSWSEVHMGLDNPRKEYEKLMSVSQLKLQLRTIKFILG